MLAWHYGLILVTPTEAGISIVIAPFTGIFKIPILLEKMYNDGNKAILVARGCTKAYGYAELSGVN